MQQSLGRMRGAFGQQSRAGQAPWAGANRGAGGFSRGGSLDQEFPSFQEAAKGRSQPYFLRTFTCDFTIRLATDTYSIDLQRKSKDNMHCSQRIELRN